MENPLEFPDTTRREVLRKAVFIAPVILTLPVTPSFAGAGSTRGDQGDQGGATISGATISGATISGGSQSERRRRRRHRFLWFSW
jgi:hypothetical protein